MSALEQVLFVFCERYGLGRPPWDSVGANAIQAAINSDRPDIAGLRRVLADYNLYPPTAAKIAALLDEAEATALPAAVTEEAPLEQEEPPATIESEPEVVKPRRTRRERVHASNDE